MRTDEVLGDQLRTVLTDQEPCVSQAGVGPISSVQSDPTSSATPAPHDQLAELQYRRKFYIGCVNKQTNAAGALVRRSLGWRHDSPDNEKINKRAASMVAAGLVGDLDVSVACSADLAVLGEALLPLTLARKEIERDMKKLARALPIYAWAKEVQGLGDLGLAVIVAEAGDLSRYPTKAHLWRRLGLSVEGGHAPSSWRRIKNGLSAEEWTAIGYSPRRRSEMHAVIADPLFRRQSVVKGPYRAVYDRRRERTAVTHPDWTKGHSHADGLRVMTKTLIRDLWREWRR